MHPLLRVFSIASFLAGLVVATPKLAHAQAGPVQETLPAATSSPLESAPARSVIVIDVAPDPELDAPQLRAAIGAELGEEAVAPGDPRAPEATGAIRISIDRSRQALVVAYRGNAEPITRTIDLPAGPAAIEHGAVLLAGNLARDEASELAASLRKPKRPPAPAPMSEEDVEANRDLEKLGAIVATGEKEASLRRTVMWPLLGVGAALATVSGFLPNSGNSTPANVARAASAGFMVSGLIVFPGGLGRLASDYDSRPQSWPHEARDALEGEWLQAAKTERRWHRAVGLPLAVVGGLCTAAAGALTVYVAQNPTGGAASIAPLPSEVALTVACAEAMSGGIYLATGPGLIEGKLHEYERATGRIARPPAEAEVSWEPMIIPAPGGGMVGVGGRF